MQAIILRGEIRHSINVAAFSYLRQISGTLIVYSSTFYMNNCAFIAYRVSPSYIIKLTTELFCFISPGTEHYH